MSKNKNTTKLFSEFPPTSTDSWMEKIKTDLKGADFNKKLVWRTMEGFDVQPFYRLENLEGLEHLQCNPGEFPFVRGNKTKDNDWLVRQDIDVLNIKDANVKALEILNKGVESLGFNFKDDFSPVKSDLEDLLKDIVVECVEINFNIANKFEEFTNELISYIDTHNLDAQKVNISINYNPIGKFILLGKFENSQDKEFETAKKLIELSKDFQNIKPIVVDGATFKNAGANISQELAYTIAVGNEYLSKLSDLGVSSELINSKIKFEFSVGTNYFMEIAKFRAARYIWAQIANQYGIAQDKCKMHIHAKTSEWHKSIYDPYVNTLRSTTEAMSAAIGSVESLTIEPFNTLYESITDQSERIARNQQIILKEEAYFKNIIDPSAGSYYIENLTNELINAAWKNFVEIDEDGGFIETFKKEKIQNTLEQGQQKRHEAISLRKEKFLGVSEFPNFNEKHEYYKPELFESQNLTSKDADVKGLTTYRGPQAFEKMRNRTDLYSKTNKRPAAFMLTYGNLAMRLARSQFSQNFFATAGFDVIDNHGFNTIEEGIAQAIDKKAEVIVLCSSDDEYPIIAPEAIKLLNDKAILVIAGYPKNAMDELKNAGVKHFIHVKSNVIETLEGFQKQIGIL